MVALGSGGGEMTFKRHFRPPCAWQLARMSESLASMQASSTRLSRAAMAAEQQQDEYTAEVRRLPCCASRPPPPLTPPLPVQSRLAAMHAMMLGGPPGDGSGGDGSELLHSGGRGGDMAEMMASLEARSRARLEHHAAALRASRPPVTFGGLDPAAYDSSEWAWAEAMGELPTVRAWVPAAGPAVAPQPPTAPAEAPDAASLSAGDVDGLRSYLAALPPSSTAAASLDSEAAVIRAMIAEAEATMSGGGGGGAPFDPAELAAALDEDDSKGDDGAEQGSISISGLPSWARTLHAPLPPPPSSHLLSLLRGESVSSVGLGPGELPPALPPWLLRRRNESSESGADGSDGHEAGQGPAGIPPSALAGSSAAAALVPSCALTRGRVVWEVRVDRRESEYIGFGVASRGAKLTDYVGAGDGRSWAYQVRSMMGRGRGSSCPTPSLPLSRRRARRGTAAQVRPTARASASTTRSASR